MTGTVVSSPWMRVAARTCAFSQLVDRHHRVSSGADLISQGRETERHAFTGEPLGLPIEGLVLPVLLEQEHREEARSGPSARDHVEGSGCLRDLLAVPAREFLADRLDHLQRARDDLERLGDVFAKLGKPVPAAGRAGTG